ncbi:MAG: DISARM system phospholipase D-like protein DrmC [Ilumatobacteraceae bacterium]
MADAVVAVVTELGDAHVRSLASAYRSAGTYDAASAAAVRQVLPAAHREHVDALNTSWAENDGTSGASIALALETALAAKMNAATVSVDVVVTGPDSPAVPVRLTSEVVRQLIADAQQRVTLVSYAAYQMPTIIAALDAAVGRRVRVDLILESPEHLDGGGGAAAYAKYRVYHWPADQRDPPDAKLHAKAVIVDSRDILLTSANMTNAAYDKNIELGLLCRGGSTAGRVQRHFDTLITRRVLVAVRTGGPGARR